MLKKLTHSIFFPIGLMLLALIAGMATQVISKESFGSDLLEQIKSTPDASNFSLMNPEGEFEELEDFQGSFVLVNFWATWCPPCVKEMPSLDRLQDHFAGQNFKVIAIHVGPSVAGINDFLTRVPLKLKILIDQNMSLSTWGVTGLPTTFLVNPQGKLIYRAIGEREWDSEEMVNMLEEIMQTEGKVVRVESALL